jgi:hypothetical protein
MANRKILDADTSRNLIVNDSVNDRCRHGKKYDGYRLHVMVFFGERRG